MILKVDANGTIDSMFVNIDSTMKKLGLDKLLAKKEIL
jgi:hypothetical protein